MAITLAGKFGPTTITLAGSVPFVVVVDLALFEDGEGWLMEDGTELEWG